MSKRCRFLLLLLSVFAFQPGFSQSDTTAAVSGNTTQTYPHTSYGIRGGANFSRFNITSNNFREGQEFRQDRSNLIRVQTGLVANHAFNQAVSLRAELLYTQKGMEFKGATPVNKVLENYKAQVILGYIEIPVLVKVAAPVYGDSLKFFVNIGPSVSYLIQDKSRLKTQSTPETDNIIPPTFPETPFKYNSLDASVHAGAGFEFLTKYGTIALEGRSVFGVMPVIEGQSDANNSFPKVFNRSVGLYVTYFIPEFRR